MRSIIVLPYLTLDGVMQAPGGPEAGFPYGGWSAPYYDEVLDRLADSQQKPPKDLLLGRKTFEMFAGFWPDHEDLWPGINAVTKYCVSTTLKTSTWNNSVFLDSVEAIKQLKQSEGSDLQVSGSGHLIQTLLQHDLVDELWLLIHPLTLGAGQKLFDTGAIPAAFKLVASTATPAGVLVANYQRAGEVQLGTMGG